MNSIATRTWNFHDLCMKIAADIAMGLYGDIDIVQPIYAGLSTPIFLQVVVRARRGPAGPAEFLNFDRYGNRLQG